tara:strand:- start:938 stop:1063 length:126 start_codon:yes stop_codon:yes gene_type:complete
MVVSGTLIIANMARLDPKQTRIFGRKKEKKPFSEIKRIIVN